MRQSSEARNNDERVYDGFVLVTDTTYQMTVRDSLVHCNTDDNAITITLPPVGEAAGKIFVIYLVSDNSGNDVTLQDYQDDSALWSDIGDVTMDDVGDGNCLYSDGKAWWNLHART